MFLAKFALVYLDTDWYELKWNKHAMNDWMMTRSRSELRHIVMMTGRWRAQHQYVGFTLSRCNPLINPTDISKVGIWLFNLLQQFDCWLDRDTEIDCWLDRNIKLLQHIAQWDTDFSVARLYFFRAKRATFLQCRLYIFLFQIEKKRCA